VQVYVDDIVFDGSSNSLFARFADNMSKEFEMSMIGELQFFLGLQIKQSKEGTFVHQAKYTKDIVRMFKMEDSKAMATSMSTTTALDADQEGEHVDQKEYRRMIGSLLYLTATMPGIRFSVCLCTRFQASSRTSHQQVVKRIFRYLRHTPDFGLWYPRLLLWRFMVFQTRILSGVGWIGSPLLGRASSWDLLWCLGLPANSRVLLNPLLRQSMLPQLVVAPSSFGPHTPSDFGEEYTHVPLQCDSTSAISVAKNPVLHSKTKHIELKYLFLRDNVEKGKIALIHVPTHDRLADIFTKPLNQATFTRLRGELGVCLIS
jgi:hypothetical protein